MHPTGEKEDRRAADGRQTGSPEGGGSRGASFAQRRAGRRDDAASRGRLTRRAHGVHAFFTRELWARELATLPTFRRWFYGFARVAQLTVANFVKDRCTWRAAALTYITILSLVPMLALAFSVAKGMGAYEQLEEQTIIPFLDSTFGKAGGEAESLEPPVVEASADEAEGLELPEGSASPADGEVTEVVSPASPKEPIPEEAVPGEAATVAETTPGAEAPLDTPAEQGEAGSASPVDPAGEEGSVDSDVASVPNAVDDVDAAEEVAAAETPTPEEEAGAGVRSAIDTVLSFVKRTDVSKLGALGFLIVLYTVIKLLGAIELSFNDIWGVRKARSLPRKVADYFSTVVLVPLLLVTGTTFVKLARSGYLGDVGTGDGRLVSSLSSLAVIWLGFAFAYILMPNTRIRVTSALVGAIVGGSMWQLFQWAHLELQLGVANYNAIYSTFAALPIFLFWVHSSWMTVLIGAEAAAAHQNQARHGQLVRSRDFDLAQKELLALRLAARMTQAFMAGDPPLLVEDLAEDLGCPERTLLEVTGTLESAGLVTQADADNDGVTVVLVVDPGIVRLQDVLDALKGASIEDRESSPETEGPSIDAGVERAFGRFRRERDAAGANITLRELAS